MRNQTGANQAANHAAISDAVATALRSLPSTTATDDKIDALARQHNGLTQMAREHFRDLRGDVNALNDRVNRYRESFTEIQQRVVNIASTIAAQTAAPPSHTPAPNGRGGRGQGRARGGRYSNISRTFSGEADSASVGRPVPSAHVSGPSTPIAPIAGPPVPTAPVPAPAPIVQNVTAASPALVDQAIVMLGRIQWTRNSLQRDVRSILAGYADLASIVNTTMDRQPQFARITFATRSAAQTFVNNWLGRPANVCAGATAFIL